MPPRRGDTCGMPPRCLPGVRHAIALDCRRAMLPLAARCRRVWRAPSLVAAAQPAAARRAAPRPAPPCCTTPSRGCRTKSPSRCASTRARWCWWSTPPATAASRRSTRAWRTLYSQLPGPRPGGAGLSLQRLLAGKRQQQGDRGLLREHLRREIPDVRQEQRARRRTPIRCSGSWPRRPGRQPQWNFHKYLIGRDGKVVASYSSMTTPEDKAFVRELEKQLARHSADGATGAACARALHKTLPCASPAGTAATARASIRGTGTTPPDRFSCCEAFRTPIWPGCNPEATLLLLPPSLLRSGALRSIFLPGASAGGT